MYFVCQFFFFFQTKSEQSGVQFSLCICDVQVSEMSNHFLFYSQLAGQKYRLYE
jgi:hypothetical protein